MQAYIVLGNVQEEVLSWCFQEDNVRILEVAYDHYLANRGGNIVGSAVLPPFHVAKEVLIKVVKAVHLEVQNFMGRCGLCWVDSLPHLSHRVTIIQRVGTVV